MTDCNVRGELLLKIGHATAVARWVITGETQFEFLVVASM
jgi:hypothetical protein